jgi:hypothetical protein
MRRNERERIYQKKQKKEEQPKVNTRYTQREGRNERKTNRKKNPRKRQTELEEKKWNTIDGPTTVRRWLAETLEGSCVVDDLITAPLELVTHLGGT